MLIQDDLYKFLWMREKRGINKNFLLTLMNCIGTFSVQIDTFP